MADKTRDDEFLDALFVQARTDTQTAPSAELMARVLADAEMQQPEAAKVSVAPRPGFVAQIIGVLGGWRPMAGLAAATVAGVWIGFSATTLLPDGLNGLFGDNSDYYLVDLEDGFAFDTGEG